MKKILLFAIVAVLLVSSQVFAGTVCVYNKTGRKKSIPVTIVWEGGCKDSFTKLKNKKSMMYTCSGTSKATLKLKWKKYNAEYYKFPGMLLTKDCVDSNSLYIKPTNYGYKWNVFQGRGY